MSTVATLPRLEVRGLTKRFVERGRVGAAAVDDVSFSIGPGETLALVGESGSGKTTLARALLRLVEPTAGSAIYRTEAGREVELLALRGRDLRAVRRELQMVFQDPRASLNPRMRVGAAIGEVLAVHRRDLADREAGVRDLLGRVGLDASLAARHPHELSGGERQRVAIARALAAEPRVLVCDEITSALDASVRSGILNLLADLQAESGLSCLLIAHDLAAVRHVAARVAVMHRGRIVETGGVEDVFERPSQPYTRTLIASARSVRGAIGKLGG